MIDLTMNALPFDATGANCTQPWADPEDWFPFPGSKPLTLETKAHDLCRSCPVLAECLAFALDKEGGLPSDSRHGVYGGLPPHQRFNIYRRKARRQAKQRVSA